MPVEWSEEDEHILAGCSDTENYILKVAKGDLKFDVGNTQILEGCQKELEWLEDLKTRFKTKSH